MLKKDGRREIRIVARVLPVVFACLISLTVVADERFERLADRLDLLDDQKPQVQALFEAARASREAARDSSDSDRRAARTARETAQSELRENLSLILTADQMEKFDTLREERRSNWGRGGRRNHSKDDIEST